jgi:hypothetical protein
MAETITTYGPGSYQNPATSSFTEGSPASSQDPNIDNLYDPASNNDTITEVPYGLADRIDEGKGDSLFLGNQVASKEIQSSFGRPEDYVELIIRNTERQVIYTESNFQQYNVELEGNKIVSLNIDAEEVLINRNFTSGRYIIQIRILRNKIFNVSYHPFSIKDISTSRKEIKSVVNEADNELVDQEVENFILEIEGSSYFKEFLLSFKGGYFTSGINIVLNTDPLKHEILFKTINPLPLDVGETFKIVEELADPFEIDIDLGGLPIDNESIELRNPNFQVDTRQNNSVPSEFKNYNELLEYNVTSSYNHLLSKLENPDTLNISYDFIRTVSSSMEELDRPYHFENFVHFSSAVERLKNFQYKLELIETYNSQIAETELVSGSLTSSATYTTFKEDIKTKKQNLIKGFDGYEQFLYFTSGSLYTWPKSNTSAPYELYSVTSSDAKTWLGDINSNIPNSHYTGQLQSASFYDNQNPYSLNKLIPEHIVENEDNKLYILFVDMIGQHFDHIWTYIKHITEINNLDNKFGISKELVYYQLQSLGINTFDQFENANLIEYILGESITSNEIGNLEIGKYIVGGPNKQFYNIPKGTKTYVTASNDGSIPKGDITKEIWKRLYNNAPYLLKTKGTERGIKALMSCYGIPSTILNVKEYGGNTVYTGPLKDADLSSIYKTFSYEKSGLALKGLSGTTGYFLATKWSSSLTDALSASAKTVEFRIKPNRIKDENQHLFTLSGSNAAKDPHLILTNYEGGTDISSSNDADRYGRVELFINGASVAQTPYFQVFDGKFWNVFIGVSGSHNTAADIKFGVHQSNYLKRVFEYTSSYEQSAADRQLTFGDPTYGDNNIGGGSTVFFGGTIDNPAGEYAVVDGLNYSGSLQEIKYHFGELLLDSTLEKHALEPFMYGGNTNSSSFEHVVLRVPLGSNDKEDSGSFHPDIKTNYLEYGGVGYSAIESGFEVESYSRKTTSSMASQEWESVIETHHLPTPDTVGASMTSEKVRIDEGSIPNDNVLIVDKKRETSTLDRQPLDYEDLGVYFSPTNEINEDILYTLGSFRLDDYIGNPLPSAQTSSFYEDLKTIKDYYFKKVDYKYNYWAYIKTIQNFDHTLFKIIEKFTPAKANLKTGLLIEPTILERNKLKRESIARSDGQTMTSGSHQTFETQISTSYADTKLYSLATSSNASSITGQYEPGSYVVSYNNLLNTTSSKTSERLEQGTNATIEIYDEYWDPFLGKKNRFGYLHAYNSQPCQSPIKPFVQRLSSLEYGIGASTIGPNKGVGFSTVESGFIVEDYINTGGNNGSFIVGDFVTNGGGNLAGVGFSGIQNGFLIEGYTPTGTSGIGSSTIGSTFIVDIYNNLPVLNPNYRTHKSNVLLGNATIGRKSKKYFKYKTYTLRHPDYTVENGVETQVFGYNEDDLNKIII